MAKYFIDTEFLEGPQTKRFLGIPIGKSWRLLSPPYRKTKPTIDLISIGIVAEDGREYYAISKDFNLKEVWNRWEYKKKYTNLPGDADTNERKVYWIRENVLHQIHYDLLQIEKPFILSFEEWKYRTCKGFYESRKNYKNLQKLLNKYGKSNEQIAEEVKEFCYNQDFEDRYNGSYKSKPEFYGYFADYDWVVFCWLFGKMIDLPEGFPWYCRDLKQILDEKAIKMFPNHELDKAIDILKAHPNKEYPKQENEHSAISDARWNKKLLDFIESLKDKNQKRSFNEIWDNEDDEYWEGY